MGWKVGDGALPDEVKQKWYDKTWGNNREKMIASMRAAGYKHTWYTGKKVCTAREFANAYNQFIDGGMSWRGVTLPNMPKSTFKTWVKKFEQDGKLNGDRFTDGKPVHLTHVPVFPNSSFTKKRASA